MTLTLAVFGDSIAYGQGAAREVDTAGARLATTLTAAGFATRLQVLDAPMDVKQPFGPSVALSW